MMVLILGSIINKEHNLGVLDLIKQSSDVIVSIENRVNGDKYLIVSDKGIGMTSSVICEYFLRAGASFRESDVWRRNFLDKFGHSRVLRSGRFGIGILAAFLIGSEIEVETRHVSEPREKGIRFKANLSSENIQLDYFPRAIGTTISIKINKNLFNGFKKNDWLKAIDWYYLTKPSLHLRINGKNIHSQFILPNPKEKQFASKWRKTNHRDYPEIHWTYENFPAFCCNGIRVKIEKNEFTYNISNFNDSNGIVRIPNISIFDPDGKLPLNLQRTDYSGHLSFENKLLNDIVKDFLAFVLVYCPTKPITEPSTWNFYLNTNYKGINLQTNSVIPWFFTQQGVTLLDKWNINHIKPQSAIAFFLNIDKNLIRNISPRILTNYLGLTWPTIQRRYDRGIFPTSALSTLLSKKLDNRLPSIKGYRILISTIFLVCMNLHLYSIKKNEKINTRYLTGNFIDYVKEFSGIDEKKIKMNWSTDCWHLYSINECMEMSSDFHDLAEKVNGLKLDSDMEENEILSTSEIIVELYFDSDVPSEYSVISKSWEEIIEHPIIPYDLKERQRILKDAYKKLDSFVNMHQMEKKKYEIYHAGFQK